MDYPKVLGHGTALTAALFALILFGGIAQADLVIDGDLTDWGVTPFSDWDADLAPNSQQTLGNWHNGSYPYGGENFDAEALYFAADANYLYLAIVQSMPEAGVPDPYGRNIWYTPGDIALNLDIGTEGGTPTGEYGYELGVSTQGADMGAVYSMPDWTLPQANVGFPVNTPSTIVDGTLVGYGNLVYVSGDAVYGSQLECWGNTYIIEAALPWDLLGDVQLGDDMLIHYTISCGNDVLDLMTDMPVPTGQVVPEPAALIFVGTVAVFGIASGRRKKNS